MKSAHPTFDLFLQLDCPPNRSIAFISEVTPSRKRWYEWVPNRFARQAAYQLIKSVDMAREVLRSSNQSAILIFEHKPQYALVLYAACLSRRVPVFFFSHGLQQLQGRSIAHRWGFTLLRWLVSRFNVWPIHLELGDEVLPGRLRYRQSIVVPHPVPSASCTPRSDFNVKRIRLGVVGVLRPDKPVVPLIDALKKAFADNPLYELRVATPFWQVTEELRGVGVELVDTTSPEQYDQFLRSTDIVLADFERSSFFFRPSGIVNDALAAGCYVIAPNYPVFQAQLSTPCRVGSGFGELAEIEELVNAAVIELKEGRVDFEQWRAHRGDDKLLKLLGHRMDEVIRQGGTR